MVIRRGGLDRLVFGLMVYWGMEDYRMYLFALLAVYLSYEYLDEVYEEQIDTPYTDVIFSAVTFGIALFFFLAIVRQRRRKIQLED
jgi:hypothetical protein